MDIRHILHCYNVLIIITDQQRADAVGYVNTNIRTPNIDKLASQCIRCANAFVQSPQCQPSRASIFTGRYPTSHKVWWNGLKLPDNEVTLADILSEYYYNTAYFGKIHIDRQHNDNLGFKHIYNSNHWLNDVGGKNRIYDEFFKIMRNNTWTGVINDKNCHHDEIVTRKAIEYISNVREPYFVVIGYHGPHPPYAAPIEYLELYDKSNIVPSPINIPNDLGYTLTDEEWIELKYQYYGMVSWIDDCVGKVLQYISDDTIVIYMSDHGDILGDHGLFSKGIYAYDGNVKIPLLIRIPGVRGYNYAHLVQSIDVFATLLDLIGISHTKSQGKSLFRAILNNKPVNDYVISMIGHNPRLRMIRTNQYKYWIYGDKEVLFDLGVDPLENIYCDNIELLNKARFELLRALILAEDPWPIIQ